MKRVEDMSVEEMEGYFKHVDKIVKIFGKSYRIFWPFNIFSPFSPTRIILNFGVLFTWIYILEWAMSQGDDLTVLGEGLARLWTVILSSTFLIGLLERHFRIKIRYRVLTRQGFFNRIVYPSYAHSSRSPPARSRPASTASHSPHSSPGASPHPTPPTQNHQVRPEINVTPENKRVSSSPNYGTNSSHREKGRQTQSQTHNHTQHEKQELENQDDLDLVEFGKGLLRKLFK